MSKEFWNNHGEIVARWETGLSSCIGVTTFPNLITDDVDGSLPAFIAWLQEGPPKRRYRITDLFEERPTGIAFNHSGIMFSIPDADIEEVFE